ncbi:hypothetical protein TWF281_008475 [Arthrobotrys megalospora]
MTTQTYLRRTNTMPTSLRVGTRHQSTIFQETNYPGPMPWPEPFQYSIPFSTKHLDGYFFTYQPRINTSTAEKETEVILRVHQEWFDRGGCQVRDGALSVDGGPVLSVVFPEAEPRRLLNLAAIVSIGYIHDVQPIKSRRQGVEYEEIRSHNKPDEVQSNHRNVRERLEPHFRDTNFRRKGDTISGKS